MSPLLFYTFVPMRCKQYPRTKPLFGFVRPLIREDRYNLPIVSIAIPHNATTISLTLLAKTGSLSFVWKPGLIIFKSFVSIEFNECNFSVKWCQPFDVELRISKTQKRYCLPHRFLISRWIYTRRHCIEWYLIDSLTVDLYVYKIN